MFLFGVYAVVIRFILELLKQIQVGYAAPRASRFWAALNLRVFFLKRGYGHWKYATLVLVETYIFLRKENTFLRFSTEEEKKPSIFQLSENFRSHRSCLKKRKNQIEWASALVPPTPFLWFEPCDHSHAEQWKNRSTRAPLGLEILGLENVSSGMPKERHPGSAWHAMRGKKKKHSHQKTRVRNARFIACAAPAKGRRCALVVAIAKRKLDFPRVRGDERSLAQDFVCCVLRRCVAGGTATSAK